MEEIARVYAEALFEAARDTDQLDEIHEQLGQFTDAIADESNDMQVFFFSPYFSSAEKREGISAAISGGDPELVNFLELLAEKHRMPAIFAIRRRFDELWAEAKKRLEVTLTSAVELDRGGGRAGRRTRSSSRPTATIDLETSVDPEHPRRPRAAGRQHGARREPSQQAGKTEKGSRLGRIGDVRA